MRLIAMTLSEFKLLDMETKHVLTMYSSLQIHPQMANLICSVKSGGEWTTNDLIAYNHHH